MKYAFLNFIRDKVSLFWMFLFPIFLMTILLSAMNGADQISNIKAYISPENPAASYLVDEDTGIFEFSLSDEYEEALMSDEIAAYIGKDNTLYVNRNSFGVSLLKSFVDNILRAQKDPASVKVFYYSEDTIDIKEGSRNSQASFFFAILAMMTYMCAYSGVSSVELYQANITNSAMRFLISPSSKLKAIVNDFLVSMFMQALNLTVSILFVRFVLGYNFINNYGLTYLVFMVGSIFSYSLGLMSVYLGNISSNARGAIVQSSMLVLSAGAGLYGLFIRNVINNFFVKIADYNPVKIIGDGFFQINELGRLDDLGFKLAILLLVSLVFIILVSLKIRKNRYDSI